MQTLPSFHCLPSFDCPSDSQIFNLSTESSTSQLQIGNKILRSGISPHLMPSDIAMTLFVQPGGKDYAWRCPTTKPSRISRLFASRDRMPPHIEEAVTQAAS